MHYFQPITLNTEEEIFKRYNKSREIISKDVACVKAWLSTQPHLPALLDDNQIRNYIILCRGSVEMTKQKIDMYFTMKSLFPDIFVNSNPFCDRMLLASQFIYFVPLPKLSRDLNRILVIKLKDKDPQEMDISAVFACLLNVVDFRLFEDLCDGHLIIFDMKHAKLGHVLKMTPMFIKAIYTIGEKALTTRTTAIHIINTPGFVDQLLLLVKSIIKPKLAERIHVYRDMSAIKTLDSDILPKDYGGKEKSLDELEAQMFEKFLEYKEFFEKRDMSKVNEDLRPTKVINDDILGYYGNFKKLDVD